MNASRFATALALGLLAGASLPGRAAIVTETYTPTITPPAGSIPDADLLGVQFPQTVSGSAIQSISKVEVSLVLKGAGPSDPGSAGDMLVYLNKDLSQTSFLLNRVGSVGLDELGYFYDGWSVTFSDDATDDIHVTDSPDTTSTLTGTFQPDGRSTAETAAARDFMLDVFNNGIGNGDWTLFVADLGSGATMTLESWTLSITGDTVASVGAVPEPSTYAAGAMLALAAGRLVWNRRRTRA